MSKAISNYDHDTHDEWECPGEICTGSDVGEVEPTFHCRCCHLSSGMDSYTLYEDRDEIAHDIKQYGEVWCDTCNTDTCSCNIPHELYPSTLFDECLYPGCEGVILNGLKAAKFDAIPYERF